MAAGLVNHITFLEDKIYDKTWKRYLAASSEISSGRVEEALKLMDKKNLLLDVGCGDGSLGRLAQEKVRHVIGIDFSHVALKSAKRKHNQVVRCDFGQAGLPFKSGVFEMVTCLDVIEHVFYPAELLCEIHRVLKINGVLILTTPNVRFIDHLAQLLLKGKFPRTSDDIESYNGGHIQYFTFSDLIGLLRQSKFISLVEKGIVYRPYKSFKLFVFRMLMRFFEKNLEQEFFCKGIAVKAKKIYNHRVNFPGKQR